jgi:DNA-binding response OmpR family regulator
MGNDEEGALTGRRILVVEDQYLLASDIAAALAAEGAEPVGPAGNMSRALELAGCEELDAAIIDVDLAGEMSFSVADELRRRNVPFLIASGYGGDTLPDRLRSTIIVEKPFEMRELLGELRRLKP